MTAGISIREYIRWDPEPPSEPTTTLVLTSPENRFVDIRINKTADDAAGANDKEGVDLKHFRDLDWAFAGASATELRNDPSGQQIVHSKWSHWIDSKTTQPESVADEGDMLPQPDGRMLERGAMINPSTGVMTNYEECWVDVEPRSTADEDECKRMCTVLMLEDDENQARGMVIRIGQFCQGVLRVGEHFSLERWSWEEESGWRRMIRMGDLWLPCGVILDGSRLELGGEVKFGTYVWKAVELLEV